MYARSLFVSSSSGLNATVPGLIWEAPPSESTTDSGHWALTQAGPPSRPRAGEPLVFLVEKGKATNNPFAMGITLGRIDNNDLVIDDGSVSRFHAWLQQDERTREWSLTDAESKNGTWVDGVKAEARKRMPLKDHSKVKLGDIELVFLLPDGLKAFAKTRFDAAR